VIGDGGATAQAQAASVNAIQAMRVTQQSYLSAIAQRGIDIETVYTLQRTANAAVVRVALEDMAELRNHPAVERVEFLPLHEVTHTTSVPFIGAPQAWGNTIGLPAGVTGQGMRVGIIDTGIDYQHPMFGGTGLLADYQANDRAVITEVGPASFPTARVVGGTDFAGDAYNAAGAGAALTPVPDPDPMDCNGHGSHVAGTTAGGGVTAAGTPYAGPWDAVTDYSGLRIGPGVAPQAQLYALRVFGCTGSTTLTNLAIEWAADPNDDGDFSDRLDVINMSLGSNYGLPFDLTTVTTDNAALTGMIVVASAGNAADTAFISGSPGVASRAISVANSVDGGLSAVALIVNSPANIAGAYPAAPTSYTDINTVPQPSGQTAIVVPIDDGVVTPPAGTTTDGCEVPFVNAAAIAGNIALIDRGTCNFTAKVFNAQGAGAIGVIVANNVVGDPVPAGLGGSIASDITIPALAVSQITGATLRAEIANGPVNVTLNSTNAGDTLSLSSSRGPRGGGQDLFLKPELAAPGTNITSAQTGVTGPASFNAGGQALTISGTSMAAPHVAGMMALVRQLNPSRTVEELKAMAVSSSFHDVTLGANGAFPRFPASRVGAGRVDVPRALAGEVFATVDSDDGSVAAVFNGEPTVSGSSTRTVRIVNRKSVVQNVTLSIDTVLDAPGMSFSIIGPTSRSIPPGGTITVDVQFDVNPDAMDRNRDPTHPAVQSVAAPASAGLVAQGNVPRHFLTEESALLIISKSAAEVARLPLYAAQSPHSTLAAQTTLPSTPASGTASLSLSGSDVCTGTRAAGVCTASLATDRVSLVSPFELGIDEPIDDTIPAYASVRYVGVNHLPDVTTPANGLFFFGVASHGKWGTLGNVAYNICVDNNEDGTFDRVVFNSDLGNLASRVFSGSFTGQDTFENAVFTPPGTVSTGGSTTFVNMLSAAQADTALHDTNVMVLAASAGQLGLTAGDSTFRYAVATCPGFNPLCVRLSPATACSSGGSFQEVGTLATYNGAARGIVSAGGLGGLPIMIPAQSGNSLPIDYDLANLTANGSDGILLLHHQNTTETKAQVVTFGLLPDDIFADGFEAQP
jgi:subtilisin family serine protease